MLKQIYKKTTDIIVKISIVTITFWLVISVFIKLSSVKNIKVGTKNLDKTTNKIVQTSLTKIENIFGVEKKQQTRKIFCITIGEECTDQMQGIKPLSTIVVEPISALLTIPTASSLSWLSYQIAQTEIIPSTYAQSITGGVGLYKIYPLFPLWQKFRDFSYLVLSIITLSIGFIILFKIKLNPQTEVTIQATLPKIVITIIFITLSFPIAGFFIDLTYLSSGIVTNTLYEPPAEKLLRNIEKQAEEGKYVNTQVITYLADTIQSQKQKETSLILSSKSLLLMRILNTTLSTATTILPAAHSFLQGAIQSIANAFIAFIAGIVITFFTGLSVYLTAQVVLDFFGIEKGSNVIKIIFTTLLGSIFIVLLLVLGFGGILIFFRLMVMFLKNLFLLSFHIIFAPIILIFSAIPGNDTISKWIRNIIGTLLPIPITLAVLYIALDLTNIDLSGTISLPLTFDFLPELINILIPLLLTYSIPNIVTLAKKAIGADDGFGILNTKDLLTGASIPLGAVLGTTSLLKSLGAMPVIGPRIQKSRMFTKLFGADKTPDIMRGILGVTQEIAKASSVPEESISRYTKVLKEED